MYLIPVLEAGGLMSGFDVALGEGRLERGAELLAELSPEAGVLALASHPDDSVEIRNFVLRGGATTITVGSLPFEIDRWNLRILETVRARGEQGEHRFFAGEVSFVGSAVYQGEVFSLVGENAEPFELSRTPDGWELAGLELRHDDGFERWSWTAELLEFH